MLLLQINKVLRFLKKYAPYITILVIIISLVQGYNLRKIGYFQIPEPFIILDEHTNIWHGLSLRKAGIPTAWSIITAYKEDSKKFGSGGGVDGFTIKSGEEIPTLNRYRKIKSPIISVIEKDIGKGMQHIPLVQPYLDHPPLGAVLLSLRVPKPVSTFADLSAYDMRNTAIFIAVITQILIAIITYQITKSYFATIVASFTYGTVPSFLLLSRYAQLENVLTPLLLITLAILLFIRNRRGLLTEKTLYFLAALAGVFAGFTSLTKLSGWLSIILGLILLIYWKFSKKIILFFAVPALIIGSLYFFWGLYLSPKLFADLFIYQGISRGFIGSLNLLTSLIKINILNFPFDGWWIGGFITLALAPRDKRYFPFFVAVILVLISALFVGGANYSWYYIPLIPFMCLSIGIFFDNLAKSPTTISILAAFFVFISSSFYWGYGVYYAAMETHNYQQPFTVYRIIFLFVIALILLINRITKNGLLRSIWYGFIIVLFLSLVLLNHHGFYYILSNWGKLPSLYTPGTF